MAGMQAQRGLLSDGLAQMQLPLDHAAVDRLLQYGEEMLRWNRRINLTAITDPQQIVTQHVLDSLSILPYVHAQRLLDVGSGGGLPGVILAIARPTLNVVSLDSRNKKVAFQRHVARELGLSQFEAVAQRVELWQPEHAFEQIVSRAFASLGDYVKLAGGHLAVGGQMLAMKGRADAAEQAGVPSGWQLVKMPRLQVPGMQAQRHLAVLQQCADERPTA